MNCQEVTRLGVVYLNGEASTSERRLIQLHLAECENCQREFEKISMLQGRISQSLKQIAAPVEPSPQAWKRLQTKLGQRNISRRTGRSFTINFPAWLRVVGQLGMDVALVAVLILVTSLVIRLLPRVEDAPAPASFVAFNLTQGKFEDVRDLAWSHNGKIAFAARDGDDLYHLYTIDPDGSGLFQLTNGTTSDTSPRWSPNGIQLAYLAAGPQKADLVMINYDGSGLHNLTEDLPGSALAFAWSPVGDNSIAYVLGNDLYLLSKNGTKYSSVRMTYEVAVIGAPVWIPKLNCLLFSATSAERADLNIYRVDSCNPDLPPALLTTSPADDRNPQMYPNKNIFLYESGPDIYIMENNTQASARLIADGFAASLSPDGSRVAFQSRRSGTNQLFVFATDPDGKEDLQIFDHPGLLEQPPVWSPDGQQLAYLARADADDGIDILIVDLKDFAPWRSQP